MCFSATASFGVAAALIPVAGYTLGKAWQADRRWLALAAFPLAFGVQQAIEGLVWLGLERGDADLALSAGRGFLVFSHFFWLAWVPLSVWLVEPDGPRRQLLRALIVIGAAFGLSIMVPAVLLPGWLETRVTGGSVEYQTRLIYDGLVGRTPLRVFYALVILMALALSSHRPVQLFGGLILISVLFTVAIYPDVFISVWCFFAAVLSSYLALVFARGDRALHMPT